MLVSSNSHFKNIDFAILRIVGSKSDGVHRSTKTSSDLLLSKETCRSLPASVMASHFAVGVNPMCTRCERRRIDPEIGLTGDTCIFLISMLHYFIIGLDGAVCSVQEYLFIIIYVYIFDPDLWEACVGPKPKRRGPLDTLL